jgi:pimeloyl-ACP methyl ester carboxylesterase
LDSVPEVRFTRSGTVDIAYQLVGEGPLDIVLMIGWVSHLEMLWELPEARHWIERFAGMGRVALFDKRGTGLSDRPSETPTNAELVPDVLAVMDAAGMNAAAVVGWIDAAAIALEVAASVPERVTALVLGETLASNTPDEDHPWAPSAAFINAVADAIEGGMWGPGCLASDDRTARSQRRTDSELVQEDGADGGHPEHGGRPIATHDSARR